MKLSRKIRLAIVKALMPPNSGRWFSIHDSFTGAWQQDTDIELDSVITFSSVFSCVRLISSDIGKLGLRLVKLNSGIWEEFASPAFSPVLRKPNPNQTRIKFFEQWVISKMLYGNTYVLKGRDARRVVTSLRVLDPNRVSVLVSDSGEVFYRLRLDHFNTVHDSEITIPATEIIHDVHLTPEHALVGVSPIGACGLAATQGLKIQNNSQKFFENMSRPGGMLTAPGNISDETAARLKTSFETKYGGDNIGKVAVAGDGLEFQTFSMSAVDSQLIEQLNWTALDVCRAFGVPAYKIGVGQMPTYNNIEALQQAYYNDTLQELIECIELLLDEGLELPVGYGTEFNLDDLLRMDTMTQTKVLGERIKAALISPDEGRAKIGLRPVPGGKYPYLQQQNFSLEALAKRDASEDPFGTEKPEPIQEPAQPDDTEQRLISALQKRFDEAA